MRININDFGKDFFAFMQKSHRDMSEEAIRNSLKEIFERHGINDSNFALISVAISGNGLSTEAKNTTTYIKNFAKKLYDKAERQKYREQFGEDPKRPEDVKKTKREKPFISLDVHRISKFSSKEDIEEYISNQLQSQSRAGLDFSELKTKTVTEFTQNEFNMPVDLSMISGKPLVQGLAESIKSKDSSETHRAENKKVRLSPDQYNIVLEEIKERLKNACEGTADINVAGGFDIDKTAHLFVGNDALLENFENFIRGYNEIMNRILNHVLDENQITDIQDDINPFFQDVEKVASSCGEEGVKVMNLCKGLKTRINHACEKERLDGRDNILQEQATFNNAHSEQLDSGDNDGRVENCEHSEEEHSQTAGGAIDNIVGTKSIASDLTPDVLEKITAWGVEGIRTMADWIEFTNSEEYEMIQQMQSMSLGRHDTND